MRAALALATALLAGCSSPREPKYGVLAPGPACDAPTAAAPDVFAELVAPDGACLAPPPATISRAGALADLDAVERVLRRGYAGFELTAMRGVRWDRVLREMRDAIGGMKEPIATDMFGAWLADRLSLTKDDTIAVTAHGKGGTPRVESAGARDDAYVLDLVTDGRRRILSAADPTLVGKDLQDCDGLREEDTATPTKGKLTGRVVMLSPRAPAPMTCTLRDDAGKETTASIAFRRVLPGGTGAGPAFEQRGTTVPILRVRSLDEERHPQELEQLTNTAARLAQQSAFVIDLRGVAPGAYTFDSFFSALLPKPQPSGDRFTLWSEVTAQGSINQALCAPTEETDLAQERASLAELAKTGPERGWLRGRSAVAPRVGGRGPTRAYPGVIVMVVDARCAGECEAAVTLLRQFPRTVLVGENTAGRGEIAEPLPYRLPRSGLWFTAGSTLQQGLTYQGRGHQPDIWLDGDRPDDAVEAIAQCAADAGCARDIVHTR